MLLTRRPRYYPTAQIRQGARSRRRPDPPGVGARRVGICHNAPAGGASWPTDQRRNLPPGSVPLIHKE